MKTEAKDRYRILPKYDFPPEWQEGLVVARDLLAAWEDGQKMDIPAFKLEAQRAIDTDDRGAFTMGYLSGFADGRATEIVRSRWEIEGVLLKYDAAVARNSAESETPKWIVRVIDALVTFDDGLVALGAALKKFLKVSR